MRNSIIQRLTIWFISQTTKIYFNGIKEFGVCGYPKSITTSDVVRMLAELVVLAGTSQTAVVVWMTHARRPTLARPQPVDVSRHAVLHRGGEVYGVLLSDLVGSCQISTKRTALCTKAHQKIRKYFKLHDEVIKMLNLKLIGT
ncbi:hypothetical protein RR46_09209 [Papilio xuthus]|uniref:Uncharacterized protein n=1 Tax=Papilio xuthus TaxID=66420 RepID=A0A194PVF3_PAPXU|nr:hypothetical protein RR46_09209 [Papilio xuthus]